jgi:hypothetical protein
MNNTSDINDCISIDSDLNEGVASLSNSSVYANVKLRYPVYYMYYMYLYLYVIERKHISEPLIQFKCLFSLLIITRLL